MHRKAATTELEKQTYCITEVRANQGQKYVVCPKTNKRISQTMRYLHLCLNVASEGQLCISFLSSISDSGLRLKLACLCSDFTWRSQSRFRFLELKTSLFLQLALSEAVLFSYMRCPWIFDSCKASWHSE